MTTALDIRGGAALGPVDEDTALKVIGGIFGAHGVMNVLGPEKCADAYGVKNASPLSISMFELSGTSMLATAVLVYSMYVQGSSVDTAVGSAIAVWFFQNLRTILTETPKKLGYAEGPVFAFTALNGAAAYGGLARTEWGQTVMKAASAISAVTGLFGAFASKQYADAWQPKKPLTKFELMDVELTSFWNVALGAASYTLLDGGDIKTAIGYATAVMSVACIKMIVTGDINLRDTDNTPVYFWTALMLVASYILLA